MKRVFLSLVASTVMAIASAQQPGQPTAELSLTRFDCGGTGTPSDISRFSDINAYEGKKVVLTFSCYLIQHGNEYMIWDAGNPVRASGATTGQGPKVSLVEQLAQLKLKPEQIKYLGISHYHGDHVGQAASFPQATLLIGKGDWDALNDPKPSSLVNVAGLAPWVSGGGKVDPVLKDKDVFGDGSVIMLDTPGHTPGHHSLLVKLKSKGNILLSGDIAHFHENLDNSGVPTFNTSRAESLASLDRFKQIAKNLNATIIIQHDARDIDKLPAFPLAAK